MQNDHRRGGINPLALGIEMNPLAVVGGGCIDAAELQWHRHKPLLQTAIHHGAALQQR